MLKGDMSLIGPRPLLPKYLPRYTKEQFRRHNVASGITGWAQVNGRNAISWEEKFKLDTYYVDNQSFILDLQLILFTIIAMFSKNKALNLVTKKLINLNADSETIKISKREIDLYPFPPPGSKKIVTSR